MMNNIKIMRASPYLSLGKQMNFMKANNSDYIIYKKIIE